MLYFSFFRLIVIGDLIWFGDSVDEAIAFITILMELTIHLVLYLPYSPDLGWLAHSFSSI